MENALKSIDVLLVEDNEIDAEGVMRSFRKHRVANPVVWAEDGMEALDILRNTHPTKALTAPYIIVLDLNLPRLDGLGFLREIRADPDLKASVVFVLTTSQHDEDRIESYRLNVAGYIYKNNVGRDFVELVNLFGAYWRVVELPTPNTRPRRGDT